MTTALAARRPCAEAVPGRWGLATAGCRHGGKDPTGRTSNDVAYCTLTKSLNMKDQEFPWNVASNVVG
jgi:hypothetical protein